MAKKASGNKSQAIRDVLAAHPDKGPTEISGILKSQGWAVSPTHVSVVKSAGKSKKGRKVRVMKRGRSSTTIGNGKTTIEAAVEFIKSAGGLQQAQQMLQQVAEIAKSV